MTTWKQRWPPPLRRHVGREACKLKFLIITADDFGLHESVNAAVQQASDHGVLTAASLMMSAPAVDDAVRRAHRTPALRVGLHVVLADGKTMLPPHIVPGLVDRAGHMDGRMFARGVRFFALPQVRRQLEAEIRAQFAAFARTGLVLDHVNVHKHFHLHPTVLDILLRVGREYGVAAMRVPAEPIWLTARGGHLGSAARGALLTPWTFLMKQRLRAAGMAHNDQVFGLRSSGSMTEAALLETIVSLPPGVTEIYLHPATESGSAIAASMKDYRHAEELAALLSRRVRSAIAAAGVDVGGFRDLVSRRARHARTA